MDLKTIFAAMMVLALLGCVSPQPMQTGATTDFVPSGDMNGRGIYAIKNFTNISLSNTTCTSGYVLTSDALGVRCIITPAGVETDPIYTAQNGTIIRGSNTSWVSSTMGNTTIARIGNCTAGQFVQNTTTGGVQCATAGGSGTPSGNDTQVQFNNNGAFGGDANFTYDSTNDRLIVGGNGTSVYKVTAISAGTDGGYSNVRYSSDTGAPTFSYFKYRGTPEAPTAILSGDVLFNIGGFGYNGTAIGSTAATSIRVFAEENFGAGRGTSLRFTTTPIGGQSQIERMRILPSGNIGMGTNYASPNSTLDVGGTITSTNLNVTNTTYLYNNTNPYNASIYEYWNATCKIIVTATARMEIC